MTAVDVQRLRDFLSDVPPAIAAGDMVGKVRILSPLGEGGMGSVWLGEHLTLETRVAVKFIAERLAQDSAARERFVQEATAAAQIQSGHVVRVLDHGIIEGGLPYIVMERLEGEDLAARLVRGPLSVFETGAVVDQVAHALHAAHELGIVHRDIKPGNVFIGRQDGALVCKLLDFGIAKRNTANLRAETSTGSLLGTPYYMSPEQLLSAKHVDARADLWSLSVLAYECLTGALPFAGDTVGAVAIRADRGAFTPASELRSGLPASVDAFFVHAFARSVDARPGTARALAEAFAAALEGKMPAEAGAVVVNAALAANVDHAPNEERAPNAEPARRVPRREGLAPSAEEARARPRSAADRSTPAVESDRPPAPPPSRWTWLAALSIAPVLIGVWFLARATAPDPLPADVPEGTGAPAAAERPPAPPALPVVDAPAALPVAAADPPASTPTPAATARAKVAPSAASGAQRPSRGTAAEPAPAAPTPPAEASPAPPAPSSTPSASSNPFFGRY
jgi:serine/threonine-protein kinase